MGDIDHGELPVEPIEPLVDDNAVVQEPEQANTSEVENEAEPDLDDENTCKICRLGSSEDNPLYYPCKCSVRRPSRPGSMIQFQSSSHAEFGPSFSMYTTNTPLILQGSIRYVHQQCLMEWIAHSKTTKCEVGPFSVFTSTRLHAPSMWYQTSMNHFSDAVLTPFSAILVTSRHHSSVNTCIILRKVRQPFKIALSAQAYA